MRRTIVVVTAGLAVPSSTRLLGDQLAGAVAAAVSARGEAVTFEYVEVRELAQDTDALNAMPVLIAATAGSARHSMVLDHAMRPLFSYLRAVVLPTGVFAATEDFGDAGLEDRIRRAAAELAHAVVVSGTDHVAGFAPDPTARRRTSGNDVAPVADFADLLRGHAG